MGGPEIMNEITFITGNQGKADFLAKHLGVEVGHQKLDLDEIQSLELHEVAEHKARQAFDILKKPVLVEDVSLSIDNLGGLPGPFIKWFEKALGLDGLSKLAAGQKVVASVCFVYFDGKRLEFFDGSLVGTIAQSPVGENGFGFDPIVIPHGHDKTLAQMSDEELKEYSLRTTTVYPKIKEFLQNL
jgi:non-canonical purine NTP pyrophosphatase (RdgB/HAM1 family)